MRILIADDDKTSLTILDAVLKKWGYEVETASDGREAWNILNQENSPCLSILDWMMPEMDGIDVIKKLKSKNPSAYSILLTSKESSDAISTALNSGADDFISKPFIRNELKARLEVGKRMVILYEQLLKANSELKKYATEMELLVEEKAKQLVHADRLSSIGMLTAGVAHEINNPTTFISGNVQTLQKFWPYQERMINECREDHPDYEKLMFIHEEMPDVINGIKNGTLRISSIVDGLKIFARQDAPKNIDYDIHSIIDEALMLCSNMLKYNVTTEKIFFNDLPLLNGDKQKIEQVLVNLFSNSSDAMAELKEGILIIETTAEKSEAVIKISDNGPGLSEKALDKIWTPFFTTKPVGKGTGLGMSISHGIIKDHGGTISVSNRPEGGAEFLIKLPYKKRGDSIIA